MKAKYIVILLFCVFFLAAILRFHKLGSVPYGFYQDESAIGYNALSILETGKDEYGKSFPLYFKSFGDYKLPIYIYATVGTVALFGLNEFAVRFPSAFFGLLTVMVFYFFVNELTKNKKLSLIATFLLAINPWHLHYNRATFEVSICLFLFVLGTWLLLLSFRKKTAGLFLLGTLCFVINLYTYNLTRLLSSIFYLFIVLFYRKQFIRTAKSELVLTIVVSLVLLVPFVGTLLYSGGASSAKGTFLFTSSAVQASLLELRSYMLHTPSLFSKLFFNSWILSFWQYLQNLVSYFSVPFFFVSGSAHGNHGIGTVGQFYLVELPFMVYGIYATVRQKLTYGYFLVGWGILVIIIASLTRDVPHATRSFFLLVPLVIFSAAGFLSLLHFLKKLDPKIRYITTALLVFVFAYNILYYFTSYYIRFPIAYAKSWRSEDKALTEFIKERQGNYDSVVFDKKAGFVYTSLLFYLPYSPASFQQSVKREPDDSEGFSTVTSFGKYEFKDIDWEHDLLDKKTLIITTKENLPEGVPILKIFTYPLRPIVLSVKEKVMQFPLEEDAYVAIETQ